MTSRRHAGRYLFNCSNLHVGGGIQVATSIISEWSRRSDLPPRLEIWASTEVDASLRSVGCDFSGLPSYSVVDTFGARLPFTLSALRMQRYERVFTLFGPLYQFMFRPYSIVGFAQMWILVPDNPASRRMSRFSRTLSRLKFKIQGLFFRESDVLVVELEHVAESMSKSGLAKPSQVRVIHNCLGSIYSCPSAWAPCPDIIPGDRLKLGYVGRNYPHKNLSILPEVRRLLSQIHSLEVDFFVTLTPNEFDRCSKEFKDSIVNVGEISVAQCPNFYLAMDGIIFPSFLECFSATPLEALAMARPLFASDRPFNRSVCGGFANYFDPDSAQDAAQIIAGYFSGSSDRSDFLAAGRAHALGFSSAPDRADRCLALIRSPNSDFNGDRSV